MSEYKLISSRKGIILGSMPSFLPCKTMPETDKKFSKSKQLFLHHVVSKSRSREVIRLTQKQKNMLNIRWNKQKPCNKQVHSGVTWFGFKPSGLSESIEGSMSRSANIFSADVCALAAFGAKLLASPTAIAPNTIAENTLQASINKRKDCNVWR